MKVDGRKDSRLVTLAKGNSCIETIRLRSPFYCLLSGSCTAQNIPSFGLGVPGGIWPLIIIITALAIVLALLLWGLKRLSNFLKNSPTFQSGTGWTLEQINELHKSGQLTDKQYQSLRDAVIRNTHKPQQESCSHREFL